MTDRYIEFAVDGPVGVITLDRPEKANAQNLRFLEQLDEAWSRAERHPDVRVIVVQANGKHFSAGHDLREIDDNETQDPYEMATEADRSWSVQSIHRWEQRVYLGYALRWRSIPKPSIAAVQGRCIAGGLLLCWPCDLIIASEDATFSDPVVQMGIAGVELHGHTWELGARKAKEWLFTGRDMDARTAERHGMVNEVVPLEELRPHVMALATEIAAKDPFGLAMAKRAVNQTLDIQGFHSAVQSVFDLHVACHGNAIGLTGNAVLTDLDGMKASLRSTDGDRS